MIYNDAGKPIEHDIQELLEHFEYDCSDYNGNPHDMEETCEAIRSFFSNPRMRGEVGRAVLVIYAVAGSNSGPHKKELARQMLQNLQNLYPDEYRQVKSFHRLRDLVIRH